MKRALPVLLGLLLLVGLACKGGFSPYATPEAAFKTVQKALDEPDAETLWKSISEKMQKLFEDGRQEFLQKPDAEKIAKSVGSSLPEIKTMDAKGFFKIYIEKKKAEIYHSNSVALLDEKRDAIREAKIKDTKYEPEGADAAKAEKAFVHFEMAGKPYKLPFVKEGKEWRLDSAEESAVEAVEPAKPAEK